MMERAQNSSGSRRWWIAPPTGQTHRFRYLCDWDVVELKIRDLPEHASGGAPDSAEVTARDRLVDELKLRG